MKKAILLLALALLLALPASDAEAQLWCETCTTCWMPEMLEYTICMIDVGSGYPDCSDLGCLSQLCSVDTTTGPCTGIPWVLLNKIGRDHELAQLVGPNDMHEVIVAGTVSLHLGELSLSLTPEGIDDPGLVALKTAPTCLYPTDKLVAEWVPQLAGPIGR